MKKALAVGLAAAMAVSMTAPVYAEGDGVAKEDLKVGIIYIGDENEGYSAAHMAGIVLEERSFSQELKKGGRELYRSIHKAIGIPSLVSDILQGHLKGQTKVNLDLHASTELERLLRRLVRNIVIGLWVMALLISSSIICTTDMTPKIWGIPALGAFGYLMAFGIVMYVFLKHIFSGK